MVESQGAQHHLSGQFNGTEAFGSQGSRSPGGIWGFRLEVSIDGNPFWGMVNGIGSRTLLLTLGGGGDVQPTYQVAAAVAWMFLKSKDPSGGRVPHPKRGWTKSCTT